jgi:amidase
MTRDPKQLMEIGDLLIDGQSTNDSFRHIYLGEDAWALVDQNYKEELLAFLPKLERKANRYEWRQVAEEGLAEWANTFRTIQGLEIWNEHGEWIQNENPTFGPGIAERFQWTSTLKKSESAAHFQLKEKISRSMSNLLGEEGLLVIPTAPGPAPLRNLHGEKAEQYRAKVMQLTCIAGLAGLPQVTVPVEVYGLPIGLSFIANRNNDRKLLHWLNDFLEQRL